jgi:MFS family permease
MYIGSISGLIIMNIVSDKYGRRFAFLIGNAFAVAGSLCNSNFT